MKINKIFDNNILSIKNRFIINDNNKFNNKLIARTNFSSISCLSNRQQYFNLNGYNNIRNQSLIESLTLVNNDNNNQKVLFDKFQNINTDHLQYKFNRESYLESFTWFEIIKSFDTPVSLPEAIKLINYLDKKYQIDPKFIEENRISENFKDYGNAEGTKSNVIELFNSVSAAMKSNPKMFVPVANDNLQVETINEMTGEISRRVFGDFGDLTINEI
jgi:hypothetical protein